VRLHAAAQRTQHVAAFQATHNAPF
jgi:hypothetical protein